MKPLLLTVVAALAAALPAVRAADPPPAPLVVHEWGTFTSFSGSDGVLVNFSPNYTDLPGFVYSQNGPPDSKASRLLRDGTVSMETPVLYFYTERALSATVKVSFPKGWITEWFPFAVKEPSPAAARNPGQSMQWDVKLLPGDTHALPGNPREKKNAYFHARETDSVPLQVDVKRNDRDDFHGVLRNNSLVQLEKFLFYRGVGTFPPPVKLQAIGKDEVRITSNAEGSVDGLVLLRVENGKVGFKLLGSLTNGSEMKAAIPAADGAKSELVGALVKSLTQAGLYEKEARAMVKTWDAAWFGETGTRLLYLVPRSRIEELLPLTITPKPERIERVLVGRHDFLTPEQEADVEKLVKASKKAAGEFNAAEKELQKIGRFEREARNQAEKRLQRR
jgi:hypothetical protein